MQKRLLMTPGPTPIPDDVLLSMAQPILHHRTPEFKTIFASCSKDLQPIFSTKQAVLMLSSSGTGAMEAAITNFCQSGDTIITVAGGKFGQRWGLIGRAYGLNVVELEVEWGNAVSVAAVEQALEENPSARGVYFQASETSTGVRHPVEGIAELCRNRANTLCVVDGITAVGVEPMEMDEWGIDILVSGSQKAFMLPPGLAFIACSEKAWQMAEASNLPRFYFDLLKERKSQSAGQTAWTSPVSLIVGLRKVLDRMNDMGTEGLLSHHDTLARGTRAGVQALGLRLLADSPATSVTAVWAPEGLDAGDIIKGLGARHIKIAGGQDHLKGRIFRIGHLGWFSQADIIATLSALESTLKDLGHEFTPGSGVSAAAAIFEGNG